MEKHCVVCKEIFAKPKKYSSNQWDNRKTCGDKMCISKYTSLRIKQLYKNRPELLLLLSQHAAGKKQSEETKIKRGIYRSGVNHPKWKGGISQDGMGYLRLNKGKKRIHRLVLEKALGRSLLTNEIVHHKDGDKQNNTITNLQIVTRAEHCRLHRPRLGTSKYI